MIAASVVPRLCLNQLRLWMRDSLHEVSRGLPFNKEIREDQRMAATESLYRSRHLLNGWFIRARIHKLPEIGLHLVEKTFILVARFDDALRLAAAEVDTQKACIEGREGKSRGF